MSRSARRTLAPAAVMLTGAVASTASGALDAPPALNPANNHTYYLLPTTNWTTAERKAISLGGHLVTIDDAAENAWVVNAFATAGGVDRNLWIGLHYPTTFNQPAWASGTPVSEPFNITQFAAGEPNNGLNEPYVHIIGPSWVGSTQIGKWNNLPNVVASNVLEPGGGRAYGAMYGVVEVDAPVAPPTPATTGDATWATNTDGFWHDTTKWAGGLVPDGVGAVARLRRAVSGTNRVAYLKDDRTVGTLITGDTDGGTAPTWYVVGTRVLTLAVDPAAAQPEIRGEVAITNIETELAGTRGFAKTGAGLVSLWDASPNLSGPINVQAGQLRVVQPQGLGVDAGDIRVAAGAALGFYPQFDATIGDRITLNGDGIGAERSGALRLTALNGHASATLTVPEVVLETNARIGVDADATGRLAVLMLSGPGNLVKTEDGKLDLRSVDNATFTGKVRFAPWSTAPNVVAGEIVVAAEGSLGPNPATFQASQVLFDYGGLIETTTTQTFDDANRGFAVGDGVAPTGQVNGGGFRVATNTTLTVLNAISGTGNGALLKDGGGELRLAGSLEAFTGRIVALRSGGTITALSPLAIDALEVQAGARVRLLGTGSGTFSGWQIGSLVVSPAAGTTPAGVIDLVSAGIRVDYDPIIDSPEDAIRLMIADGRIAAVGSTRRIGYGEASVLGIASFLGVPVDGSTVVLLRTLAGDANLDGVVGFADLVALAQHYGAAGVWTGGDFSYDGLTNFADLVLLAQNYSSSASSLASADALAVDESFAADWALARSLVPEPATLSLGGGALLLAARRRR